MRARVLADGLAEPQRTALTRRPVALRASAGARAQAVWAGWGHASENPKLPEALARTKNKVCACVCCCARLRV